MGNVNSNLIEHALDNSVRQQPSAVCDEIRRLAADPSQRELYRLLCEEMEKGSATTGQKLLPETEDQPTKAAGNESQKDMSGVDRPASASQPKAMAPKKKFLSGYRGDDDKPEDKPVSDQQQPVAPPAELDKADKAQETKQQQQQQQQQQQPVAVSVASTDSKESVRSRSNTVSFPVRSRALPPATRRAVPEKNMAPNAPATPTGPSTLGGYSRSGNTYSIAAAGNDETRMNQAFAKQRGTGMEYNFAASGQRTNNPVQDSRNSAAAIRAPPPVSTAYYTTIQQQQQQRLQQQQHQQQQQQQQYVSRPAEAKTQQQQQQHNSQFADRPPRQPQQMERTIDGQQMSPYYSQNTNVLPQGYTGSSKISHGDYDPRAAGRPGMEYNSRQMQPAQQHQQHAPANQRWPADRYGQMSSSQGSQSIGQGMDGYPGRMEHTGVSAAKYRAVDPNYGGNMTGTEVHYERQRLPSDAKYLPSGSETEQRYDRQRYIPTGLTGVSTGLDGQSHFDPRLSSGNASASQTQQQYLERQRMHSMSDQFYHERQKISASATAESQQQQHQQQNYERQRLPSDPKYMSAEAFKSAGGYSKPRAETVRQQVHEQFESMFPPPVSQASSRFVQRSPHGNMAGFQPMEPVEPTVQPRIPGLMHASPATSDRSSRDSERYGGEQMYQQRSAASKVDSESQQRRMMRTSAAGSEAPASFISTPETSTTRSSQSSGSRPDRIGPESPLDLTIRRDEPLTAEAFLRRCHEPVQDLDYRATNSIYAAAQQYRTVAKSGSGQYLSEPTDLDRSRGTHGGRYTDYQMAAEQRPIPVAPEVQMDPRRAYVQEGPPPADWQMPRRTPSSADTRFSPRSSQLSADSKSTFAGPEPRYTPVDDQKMAMWSKCDPVAVSDARPTYSARSSEQYSSPWLMKTELTDRPSSNSSARMQQSADARLPAQSPRDIPRAQPVSSQGLFDQKMSTDSQQRVAPSWLTQDGVRSQQTFISDGQQQQQCFRAMEVDTQPRYVRTMDVDAGQTELIRAGGRSPSLPQLSPVPPAAAAAAASRRIPIVQLLGSHSPSDILHLRCNVCASTYGSLRSFRMHFAKVHGLEPSPEHFTIQTISDARSLMTRGGPIRDLLDDSQSVEDSPPSLQRESVASVTLDAFPLDVEHRKPAVEYASKQIAEVYPIPKKSSPFKQEVESNPPTPTKKSSPVPVKRSGEERNMKCMKCGHFSTQDWGVFRRHIRTHSECVSGGSETPDPADVDIDTGCAVCLEGFSDVADWKMHVASQHMMRSCACKSCDLGFTNAGALRRHLSATHGVESAVGADIEVEYRCLFCPEVFTNEQALYAHTHAHEHRYSAQRNLRYSRPGFHGFAHQHHVQTAIPDTTCPEDQNSSGDGLSSSKSGSAFDSLETQPTASDASKRVVSAAVGAEDNSSAAVKTFTEPMLKLDSRKASILRRLSADGEAQQQKARDNRQPVADEPTDNRSVNRMNSSGSDDFVGHAVDQPERGGETKTRQDNTSGDGRKPVFGDLLRSMRHEVETTLRGFDTESFPTTPAAQNNAAASLAAHSTASATRVRDIYDAIITQSLRQTDSPATRSPRTTSSSTQNADIVASAPSRQTSPRLAGSVAVETRRIVSPRASAKPQSPRLATHADNDGKDLVKDSPAEDPKVGKFSDTLKKVENFSQEKEDGDKTLRDGNSSVHGSAEKSDDDDELPMGGNPESANDNPSLPRDQPSVVHDLESNADGEPTTADDPDIFEKPLCIDLNRNTDDEDV